MAKARCLSWCLSSVLLAAVSACSSSTPESAPSGDNTHAGTGANGSDRAGATMVPAANGGATATSNGGASATSNGGGTTGVWRPFNDASPWNTTIPNNPELEPDTAALIEDFTNSSPFGVHLDVNISGYSVPLYWSDGATPTYPVLVDWGGAGWPGDNGNNCTGTIPLPDGATPDPESDHHLLVINRQQHLEWGCWNLRFEGSGWRAGLCATADLTGTGVRTPQATAAHWYDSVGARACGFPLVAGLIRTEEIAAGRVDHALVVAYPHIRAGWYTPPASTSQGATGTAISTRGIPCGGHIQLDPAVDLDALRLSPAGRAILRALQQYGAYVGDFSGAISLYAENSKAAEAYWASGVLDTYELQGKLDFSRLRVLKLGTLYNGGNG